MAKVTSKEGVTRWLNRLAKSVKQFVNIKDYSGSIEKCSQCVHGIDNQPYVQLYKGIHDIGELLNINIDIYDEDDDNITYSFMWNDVMFLEVDSKTEEKV